jgi:ABC-2 type transport system ATP-binding protein
LKALLAEKISKSYSGHQALDTVSMEIPEQVILGLLGPNGAGKTTLIRIINQIIQPDSGEIFLFGNRLSPEHIGQIGYLPEERGLYRKMKVGEQLMYLAQLKGMSRKDALQQIRYWFERFEITAWWDKKLEDLSKGMAQKVQFISTILHQPRLIILDEPFSGFDPINAQKITEIILELKKQGSTIIFSTHRMETVESLCDHIVLINQSKKILEGPSRQVREQFRSNTFLVEHRTAGFDFSPEYFELMAQDYLDEQVFKSQVRLHQGGTANQLLEFLLPKTEIISFQEKIPSMAEIFIQLVGADSIAGAQTPTNSN